MAPAVDGHMARPWTPHGPAVDPLWPPHGPPWPQRGAGLVALDGVAERSGRTVGARWAQEGRESPWGRANPGTPRA